MKILINLVFLSTGLFIGYLTANYLADSNPEPKSVSIDISEYEIPEKVAKSWIANYESAGFKYTSYTNKAGVTFPNLNGFQVKHGELAYILDNNKGKDITVWSMLAINNSSIKWSPYEPEMIFAVKDNGSSNTTYYNFTSPCPDACPNQGNSKLSEAVTN